MTSKPVPPSVHAPAEAPDASSSRVEPAWRAWLQAWAKDAEAALGAALAYEALDPQGREAFLQALEQDAPQLAVPRVALFAPILSVEQDPLRRERVKKALGDDMGQPAQTRSVALLGHGPSQETVVVVIAPLYLDFVRVISCRFSADRGMLWVRDEPLTHGNDAPKAGSYLESVLLEPVPLTAAIDEVARAIVAQRRRGQPLAESLQPLLDLFDGHLRAGASER